MDKSPKRTGLQPRCSCQRSTDEFHEWDHWYASEGCYFDGVEILEIARQSGGQAPKSDLRFQLRKPRTETARRSVRLCALGLRRDPHGYVKQIHHEELEDGEKERPSAFPKITLK